MSQKINAYFINVFHNFLSMMSQESAAKFLFDGVLTPEAIEIQSRDRQVKHDVSKYIANCKKTKFHTRSDLLRYLLSDMAVAEGFMLHENDFSLGIDEKCPRIAMGLVATFDMDSCIEFVILPDGNMFTVSRNLTQTAVRGRTFREALRIGVTQLVRQQADHILDNQSDLLAKISVVKAAIVGKHNKTVQGRLLELANALDERGYKV